MVQRNPPSAPVGGVDRAVTLNAGGAGARASGLEPQVTERDEEGKAVAAPRVAGVDIVAAPGQRDRQAVVLIGDAEAVANRFPAVPAAQRVVPHARQIYDGRTEHRPVAREGDPAAGADFLAILKILGQAGDVAVEARIAEHGLGRPAANRRITFVAPADRKRTRV